MNIISLRNITLGHGGRPLIENGNLTIEKGQKIALLGRNGAGKSTLLKLIQGDIEADSGVVERAQGITVASLAQQVPQNDAQRVYEVVAEGLNPGQEDYHVSSIIHKMQLNPNALMNQLSGGQKRRVLLAKALVSDPDLLLLDEPTNHLDINSIEWLEKFLKSYNKTILFVTHDRTFMQNIATKIIEIEMGELNSWLGTYEDFLTHKEATQNAKEKEDALFAKRLTAEETWIRQGIKARRTRNEGRVRALKKMREENALRRKALGTATIKVQEALSSGKIVIDAEKVNFNFGENTIIRDFSTIICRGDKIGILGPNGSGKTTLLNLLLGELIPSSGIIKTGTQLSIAYFDQHRQHLDEKKSVLDNVCEGSEVITVGDKQVHIISYLKNFLFTPEQARGPIRALSGGERNRLVLAKLFTKPTNLLVLDEPTNDLDIESLEVLEDQLMNYQGTLLLISHDRTFLNNIVTSTLVMEGNGHVSEYVGGYDDWLRQRPINVSNTTTTKEKSPSKSTEKNKSPKKLSYKDQRELNELPDKIKKLEKELSDMTNEISSSSFYQQDQQKIIAAQKRMSELEIQLTHAYERWEKLLEE